MAITKKLLSDLMEALGSAVTRGDDRALTGALKALSPPGEIQPALNITDPIKAAENPEQPTEAPLAKPESVSDIRGKFSAFENREALEDFIRAEFPTRNGIHKLAKSIRVAVRKDEDYDTIADKIVDATIGYRLRSRAIRGES